MADRDSGAAPRVSVMMATYNGTRFIAESIDSILGQTFTDWELVIGDDCSTDGTAALVSSIADPRIRLLRNAHNLGVVGTRTRCFEACRGAYVAMLDHDDLARPLRLAAQVAYLDRHPDIAVLGTQSDEIELGRVLREPETLHPSPDFTAWMLRICNPLTCSSIMFRAEVARALDPFLREDRLYADDFDFYHRMARFGGVFRLPERLTLYRRHPGNTYRKHEALMLGNAEAVLRDAYVDTFGDEAGHAASLVTRHVSGGVPVRDAVTLAALRRTLDDLTRRFLAERSPDAATVAAIETEAATLWRRVVRRSLRELPPSPWLLGAAGPAGLASLPLDQTRRVLRGVPALRAIRRHVEASAPGGPARSVAMLGGARYVPDDPGQGEPPRLFVVIDTEAEFDWNAPFAADLVSVAATAAINWGQDVLEAHGVRPIYVVDYPVASQPASIGVLAPLLARGAAHIGAHLHPWTNPPHEEDTSPENSYAGNLPPVLEARKLRMLTERITQSFGVQPRIYRAGRYGVGPSTARTLAELGYTVDLSILAGADLRPKHGPDFSAFDARPYRTADGAVLSLPTSRGRTGLLRRVPAAGLERAAPILSRLRLRDTITLTPEGVTLAEQTRLIRALLGRGQKLFLLHFHSPSLAPGHTPYVRDETDRAVLLARIEGLCRFFFDEIGGLPGMPETLLRYAAGRPATPAQAVSGETLPA